SKGRNAAVHNRHVALERVEPIVHRQDEAAANQEGGHQLLGNHFIDSSAASRLAILPCLTAINSARMLTAISCGVTAPMSRPIGAWTRFRNSAGMFASASAS